MIVKEKDGSSDVDMYTCLQKIATGPELSKNLSEHEAYRAMSLILEEGVDEVQAGIFLIALRMKRETDEELRGVLKALKQASIKVTGLNGTVPKCKEGMEYDKKLNACVPIKSQWSGYMGGGHALRVKQVNPLGNGNGNGNGSNNGNGNGNGHSGNGNGGSGNGGGGNGGGNGG